MFEPDHRPSPSEIDRMDLVDHVQDAYGGLDRWRAMKGFTAHVSISGAALPPPDGRPPPGVTHVTVRDYGLPTAQSPKPSARDLVVEGETTRPSVRIYGSTDLNRCVLYTPRRVEFRDMADPLHQALDEPLAALRARDAAAPLNQVERSYIFGALTWEAVAGPFLLRRSDATLSPAKQTPASKSSPAIDVAWPETLVPLAPRKRFHLNDHGHLVRAEYALDALGFGTVVDTISAPVNFGGIVVSTLRRLRAVKGGNTMSLPLIDIEIFDIRFH